MPRRGAGSAGGRDGSRARLKNAGFFAGHEARGGVRKTCQFFRARGNVFQNGTPRTLAGRSDENARRDPRVHLPAAIKNGAPEGAPHEACIKPSRTTGEGAGTHPPARGGQQLPPGWP